VGWGAAVVRAARSGKLLYHDAYQLTGFSGEAFDRYAETLNPRNDSTGNFRDISFVMRAPRAAF
jgi:hypothetical protein